MSGPSRSIAVLGAGSWGSALAMQLARNGCRVRLWGRDPQQMARMSEERANTRYLPGITFPEGLEPTDQLEQAVEWADDILVAVPSHTFRALLESVRSRLSPSASIAWATKGLEPGSGLLLHEVAGQTLHDRPAVVISGPTFAREVAEGLPTAVTVASSDPVLATRWADYLHGLSFRVYSGDDVVGVELGGAVKNVLALAAGIADGLGFGANTRAALITRGLAEMMRLGQAVGGRPETFMGLAGLGDLVLTCTDDQSRNRRVGLALGRGVSLEAAIAGVGQAVEGVKTAPEIAALARRTGVEMPIVEQICRVVGEGLPPQRAVEALLAREPKPELG